MAAKDLDLVAALGVPEAPTEGEEKPAKSGPSESNYLAGKTPKLRAYLMDAVDQSLSHEERAEALCRALEEQGGGSAPPALEGPPAPPVGAGFEDY